MEQVDPADLSWKTLDVLQDTAATEAQRHAAFEQMLGLPAGWWGERSLTLFATACALSTARVLTRQKNLPLDSVDWESVATDSLVVLYNEAEAIHSSPRAWLKGVIRNLVLNEIRQEFRERAASAVSDDRHSREQDEPSSDGAIGSADAEEPADERVLRAIQALPPSLSTVGRLLFVDRLSRHEIAEMLGLTSEALRQRIHRLREQLADDLRRGH